MVTLIAGTVFNDLDFDGVRDSQEAGLENFEIQLLDSSGNIEATTTTDADGFYQFSNLESNPYIVRQVSRSGFVQTLPTFATETIDIVPGVTDDFQSPVNIANVAPIEFDEIFNTSYDGEGAIEIENTGSSFEVIYEAGNDNFVNLNGEEFELINIHFHSLSEHAIDGELSDLEMHLVHGNETGGLTVFGVLIEEGEFNPTLAPIFNTVDLELKANGELSDIVEFTEDLEIAELLPDNSGWFYNGSLTTPPFSEGVNWFVFEESIEVSSEQIDVFQDFLESVDLESNNRDLQPLNGRQFNELNYQIQVTGNESITDLDFGNTPVDETVGGNEPIFGTTEADVIEITGSDRLIFTGDMNDLVDAFTGEGNNRIYAGNGDDTLILGKSDRIFAGAGDDKFFVTSSGNNTITGGEGADQFWIASAELPEAANVITDFMSGEDVIGIAGLGIGFADVSITDMEGDALIAAGGSDLAILSGVAADSLSESDFAFV